MALAGNASSSHHRSSNNKVDAYVWALSGLVSFTIVFFVWQMLILEGVLVLEPEIPSPVRSSATRQSVYQTSYQEAMLRSERVHRKHRPTSIAAIFDETPWKKRNEVLSKMRNVKPNACGYTSGLYDLTEEELHPQAGARHMVTPPSGGKLSLVCCETTNGNLAMVAHHNWAPLGAARFLEMVTDGYFDEDSTVPMFRCIKDFICQFGLNSDPQKSKTFDHEIEDDPQWLPPGPSHRENEDGVKRFAKGYLAYAGGGPNTRGNQFIVALQADGPLAGGSPWEVPWGEVVGEKSFETLSKIYVGYGDDGPDQGELMKHGVTKSIKKKFKKLDYINKCVLVDERETEEIGR